MKRLIFSALTALALVFGSLGVVVLTVATAPQASAACPYTGCIDTRTYIKRPKKIKAGTPFKVTCRVKAMGTAKAVGHIKAKVKGPNDRTHKYVIRRQKVKLDASQKHTFTFKGLGRGTYRVYCTYLKKKNSAFRPSGVNKKMVVVRKHARR